MDDVPIACDMLTAAHQRASAATRHAGMRTPKIGSYACLGAANSMTDASTGRTRGALATANVYAQPWSIIDSARGKVEVGSTR